MYGYVRYGRMDRTVWQSSTTFLLNYPAKQWAALVCFTSPGTQAGGSHITCPLPGSFTSARVVVIGYLIGSVSGMVFL